MSTTKKQCYKVISREDVLAALDKGFVPAIQVFLDDRDQEIGTGMIILADPEEKVVKPS